MKNYLWSLAIVIICLTSCSIEKSSERAVSSDADGTIVKASYDAERQLTHLLPDSIDAYNVGFLIMDGTFNTELTAPFDIFQHTKYREGIKPMRVFTLANSLEPITTFEGIRLLPDYDYTKPHPQIDILVVPSAEHHLDTDLDDTIMIEWVREVAENAQYVTSHCDGAFVLAQTGLLDGLQTTTFPADREAMRERFPNVTVHDEVLFVHDEKYITSAGGAKSFEAALYLSELMYGKKVADRLAQGLVINWDLGSVPHLIAE